MQTLTLALTIALLTAAPPTTENPCTNGSFEKLAPSGFPADWSPVETTVDVSSDAHSGNRSLRLLRTAQTETPETGLNRGPLIDRLKGGIDFWYKAISAKSAQLNIHAIPMSDEPIENTGSPRATFTVPESHVGDGRWHHTRLKYDFTDNPKVRWIHFAARIVGTGGELLLDDFSYLDRVGTILRFGKVRLEEDADRPGERCTVRVAVESAGDAAARDVRAAMVVPDGFQATPTRLQLGRLAPGKKAQARWTLSGSRVGSFRFEFIAASDSVETETSLTVAPELTLRSFGPRSPVAMEKIPVALECVLENTGSAAVVNPSALFRLPSGPVTRTAERLAPGQTLALVAPFTPARQTTSLPIAVRAAADNVDHKIEAQTTLVVGKASRLPPLSGNLRAVATDDFALLENEHVQLFFRRNDFGFGPAELSVSTPEGGRATLAWLPRLGRLVLEDNDGARHEHVAVVDRPPRAEGDGPASLEFLWESPDSQPAGCRLRVRFELAEKAKVISTQYELTCKKPCKLLALDGPMLYAMNRDEAVFPGLEWLVDDEVSSGTLDIAEGHPHQVRHVVHPNMVTIPAVGIHSRHGTVGLLWDVHRKWDGQRDRPSVVFASPDRFENQRAHLVGLFLPSVSEFVEPNAREAAEPYPLRPDRPVRLAAHILADGTATDALAAVDQWARLHRLPDPAPLPHGSYDREIEFSMQAYLESLWQPETKDWWTSKGSSMMSQQGRPPSFVADLLLGEILSPSDSVRRTCRARADEVLALIGGEPRIDALRFHGRADLAMANPLVAASLLASRDDQGAWRFDADHVGTGPFEGADYHDLGPDEAVELGTCARKAFEVLRYARIAGDREAYDAIENTLVLMESFRVPRAAQVWEVPVHTPDVLAAADAVDAYLEAYRFSGDPRWLENAVAWARRGLPFIYLWDDPEKPFLVGGSIPVFGATWYQGSWFGCPVQWNGLRYANALVNLAEHDESYDWRRIAELVVHSAIHQQDLEGENVALWPDNISAIDCQKCPWVFAPRQIIRNVLKLSGRDEDPATVIVGQGDRRLHLTAVGRISKTAWDGGELSFALVYPPGEQGVVLVSNVTRPETVLLDGRPIAEREDVEKGPQPGWRYDLANAYLSIRVPREGESHVQIRGAEFRSVRRLPWLIREIKFEFDESPAGWSAANHVASVNVAEGLLAGTITGPDPYLVRSMIRVEGDDSPLIRLRMRLSAGQGGQLFWTTESSPGFAEDKAIPFALRPDGQFHEYVLNPARHPLWSGQTITALRIDPGNGALSADFAVDYIRGGKE